jgi:hypothetical protein
MRRSVVVEGEGQGGTKPATGLDISRARAAASDAIINGAFNMMVPLAW